MNKQETFDYVIKHLYTQGKPALNNDGECMYRTSEGLMCAVGCLIPDNLYNENMEFTEIMEVSRKYKVPENVELYREMLLSLQRIHDRWGDNKFPEECNYNDIEHSIIMAASWHDLVYNKPY